MAEPASEPRAAGRTDLPDRLGSDERPDAADLGHRTDYDWGVLEESAVAADPIEQLRRWLAEAAAAEVPEHNAMALVTVGPDGPTARNVLLRGLGPDGLRFFTNRESRKGRELAADPRASALFSWLGLHRQVLVTGTVAELDDAASDEYFDSRPRDSRLGAWASRQSEVIADRSVLDGRVAEVEARFAGAPVPRPPFWGGYVLTPVTVELWQGRPSRLHDRLRYRRRDDGWALERLSP